MAMGGRERGDSCFLFFLPAQSRLIFSKLYKFTDELSSQRASPVMDLPGKKALLLPAGCSFRQISFSMIARVRCGVRAMVEMPLGKCRGDLPGASSPGVLRTGKTEMQLQREKPGEALTPAMCVHAGVGAGGCMSRLPPSREFRESPGSAAVVLAWLGSQKVGKYRSVPERGSPQAGRRAAAASRARPGRERRVRGAPTASELYRLRGERAR